MQLVRVHPEAPGAKILPPHFYSLTLQHANMPSYQGPTKEQVRQYLQHRFGSAGPVPSISEIRNALGWVECQPDANEPSCQDDITSERDDSTA